MKKLLYITLAMLTAASCSKQGDMVAATYDGQVRISSSIATRTAGNKWLSGDAIGLYMGSEGIFIGENAKYITTGSGDFLSESPLYYPATGEVDFMAYYPYMEGIDLMNYALDVTDQSSQSAIDLLKAEVTDVTYSPQPLDMTFEHQLSRVEFSFVTGEGVEWADLAGADVVLSEVITTGIYDLTNEAVTLGTLPTEIKLSTTVSGSKAEAIILPQSLKASKLHVRLSDDRCFVVTLAEQIFEGGKEYKYRATISSDLLISSSTIQAWGTGNSTEGEDLNALLDIVEVKGNSGTVTAN